MSYTIFDKDSSQQATAAKLTFVNIALCQRNRITLKYFTRSRIIFNKTLIWTTLPHLEINDFPAEGQLSIKWCESLRWETQDGSL